MKKYYVDVENTGSSWLPLARTLGEDDRIALYTSRNTAVHYGSLIPAMDIIRRGQLEIREGWVRGTKDSALDYFLMGEVNNEVMRDPLIEAVIVSNDRGYDDFIKELSTSGYKVRRINAWLKDAAGMPSIKAAGLRLVPSPAEAKAATVAVALAAASTGQPEAPEEQRHAGDDILAKMAYSAAAPAIPGMPGQGSLPADDGESCAPADAGQDGMLSAELAKAIYAAMDEADADEVPPSVVRKAITQHAPAAAASPYEAPSCTGKPVSPPTQKPAEGPYADAPSAGKKRLKGAALQRYVENGLRMTVQRTQGKAHDYTKCYDFHALANAFIRSGGNFASAQALIKDGHKRQVFGCLVPTEQRERLRSVVRYGL